MTSPPSSPNLIPNQLLRQGTQGVIPRQGDIAFAVSVSTLYDLTLSLIHWPVWFRKTNTVDLQASALTLSNVIPGGACLNILSADNTTIVTQFTNEGIYQTHIEGWIDFHYQVDPEHPTIGADPPTPPVGSNDIRMYARDGRLWFKVPGIDTPQRIPFGDPPGPSARVTYWMAGG